MEWLLEVAYVVFLLWLIGLFLRHFANLGNLAPKPGGRRKGGGGGGIVSGVIVGLILFAVELAVAAVRWVFSSIIGPLFLLLGRLFSRTATSAAEGIARRRYEPRSPRRRRSVPPGPDEPPDDGLEDLWGQS